MSKSIIITGATGNLGGVVKKELLERGYRLYTTILPTENPKEESNVVATALDLSNEEACSNYVKGVFGKEQEVVAGILLVGGFQMGSLLETDFKALDKMFQLNFFTAFAMVKPIFEQMSNKGGGQLILVGARPAIEPHQGKNAFAYALSKSLIFRLAEMVNATGKERNVHATVIVPSTIDTPQNRASMPAADPSNWVPASNIAETISFLLTASGSMLRESVIKVYNKA